MLKVTNEKNLHIIIPIASTVNLHANMSLDTKKIYHHPKLPTHQEVVAVEPVAAAGVVELEPAAVVGYGIAAAVDAVGVDVVDAIAPLPRAALPAAAARAAAVDDVVEKTVVAAEWQCKGCSQR